MRHSAFVFIMVTVLFIGHDLRAEETTPLNIRLSTAVNDYDKTLNDLISKENNESLIEYYKACKYVATELKNFSRQSIPNFTLPENTINFRKKAFQDYILPNDLGGQIQQEVSAYEKIALFLKPQFMQQVAREKILLERKYFEEDDKQSGFLFEACINSHLCLTQYDEDSTEHGRKYGVSPWEVTIRVEPLMTFDSDNTAGFLLSTGLLMNLFPKVNVLNNQVSAEDNWASGYIKRVGLKLGAGGDVGEGGSRFIGGAGLQIASFSIWGIYQEREDRFVAAISASDLDWVKKILPFF